MMEIFLLVLVCFLQVETAFSIDCFKCHSTDYRRCDEYREKKSCPGKERQCYSLLYENIIDEEKEDNGFMKGCVDENEDCNSVCQYYKELDYKECKVTCCRGDFCNKNGFQDLADQQNKISRRSSIENKNENSNSSSYSFNKKHIHFVTLFCLLVLVISF